MSTRMRKPRKVTKAAASSAVGGRAGAATRKNPAAAGGSARFSAVLKDVLGNVPESAREGFVRSVASPPEDEELDPSLWGRGPSSTGRQEFALENLRRQYGARRAVLEASLTRAEAAGLLEVSEQAVLDRLESGDLVGLKKGREWRLPAWQFHPDSPRGFVPGLSRIRDVFPGGVVSLTEWATTGHADLDGATPAEQLVVGRVDAVVRAASVGMSAAW